jgi:hypothetical protein
MPVGAAWSLRKLNSAYSGPCIRVRRSLDNSVTDIGFSNGRINSAALLGFAGTGDAFVTTFYDQSDHGQNLTQSQSAYQPQIVSAGTIITEKGKPAIRFDGTNDYLEVLASNEYFKTLHCEKALIGIVTRVGYSENPNIACGFIDTGGALNSQTGYTLFYDNRSVFNRINAIINIVANSNISPVAQTPREIFIPQKQNCLVNLVDVNNPLANNRSTLILNNNNPIKINGSSSAPSSLNSTRTLKLGAVHTVNIINYHFGTIQEVVIYLDNQSAASHFIRSNINSYYHIY